MSICNINEPFSCWWWTRISPDCRDESPTKDWKQPEVLPALLGSQLLQGQGMLPGQVAPFPPLNPTEPNLQEDLMPQNHFRDNTLLCFSPISRAPRLSPHPNSPFLHCASHKRQICLRMSNCAFSWTHAARKWSKKMESPSLFGLSGSLQPWLSVQFQPLFSHPQSFELSCTKPFPSRERRNHSSDHSSELLTPHTSPAIVTLKTEPLGRPGSPGSPRERKAFLTCSSSYSSTHLNSPSALMQSVGGSTSDRRGKYPKMLWVPHL